MRTIVYYIMALNSPMALWYIILYSTWITEASDSFFFFAGMLGNVGGSAKKWWFVLSRDYGSVMFRGDKSCF